MGIKESLTESLKVGIVNRISSLGGDFFDIVEIAIASCLLGIEFSSWEGRPWPVLSESSFVLPEIFGAGSAVPFLPSQEGILLGIFLRHDDFEYIIYPCLLYTSPSPRDKRQYRMPSSA